MPSEAQAALPPSKRGKYVSKACDYCHQRKIKCDGETPCRPCQNRGRECVRAQHHFTSTRGRKRKHPVEMLEEREVEHPRNDHPAVAMLLGKLAELGQDIRRISSVVDSQARSNDFPVMEDYPVQDVNNSSPTSALNEVPLDEAEEHMVSDDENRRTFMGETSINQTLQHVEESLLQLGGHAAKLQLADQVSPSVVSAGRSSARGPKRGPTMLRHILQRYCLRPSQTDWSELFDLYCDEVYPLYPIFHLPSLKQAYDELHNVLHSDESFQQNQIDAAWAENSVHILICLALGRCTTSTRTENVEGSYSAGWSFYCAAMDLLGDIFHPRSEGPLDIGRLQTLNIMVIYLIRLDALERAQKTLSLGVSHAHNLALHREKVVERLPVFVSEVARRNWWCMYVLDRRLALDTGRPFLLHDLNIDTKLPFDFSDKWLSEYKESRLSLREVLEAAAGEIPTDDVSPIPYTRSMIGYSKIVGKVWDALYQAEAMDQASNPALFDCFEDLLTSWSHKLPPKLNCEHSEPYDRPPGVRYNWEMKHRLLVHMRLIWLRLLIRKPLRRQTASRDWLSHFDNETICIKLAERMVNIFVMSFEEFKISTFPFLQYLLGSTCILLGLMIKLPTFKHKYGALVIHGISLIRAFCQRTWVSGKTARSVAKLIEMASDIVGRDALLGGEDLPPPGTVSLIENNQQPRIHELGRRPSQIDGRDFDLNRAKVGTAVSVLQEQTLSNLDVSHAAHLGVSTARFRPPHEQNHGNYQPQQQRGRSVPPRRSPEPTQTGTRTLHQSSGSSQQNETSAGIRSRTAFDGRVGGHCSNNRRRSSRIDTTVSRPSSLPANDNCRDSAPAVGQIARSMVESKTRQQSASRQADTIGHASAPSSSPSHMNLGMNQVPWLQQLATTDGSAPLVTTDYSFENFFTNEMVQNSILPGSDTLTVDFMDNAIFNHFV